MTYGIEFTPTAQIDEWAVYRDGDRIGTFRLDGDLLRFEIAPKKHVGIDQIHQYRRYFRDFRLHELHTQIIKITNELVVVNAEIERISK